MSKSLAFISFGILVGNLAGLTSASISGTLLSLVFVFAGGSIITLITKLKKEQIKEVEKMIFFFSISCLIGIYSGIFVSEYKLLTPKWSVSTNIGNNKYLRKNVVSKINAIDNYYRQGIITKGQAYDSIYVFLYSDN